MSALRSRNHLLASLSADDFAALEPHFQIVEMIHESVLFKTGDPITRVYFPYSGIISLVADLAGGEMIEVAMVGRDGAVGGMSQFIGNLAANTGIIQLPGVACCISPASLAEGWERSARLRAVLVRNEQFAFVQAQQSAACNASHSVEARMARWILRVRDLSGADSFPLTQEFLAQMIGSRRTSVSLTANALQEAGLIRYRRGHMEITNVEGLEGFACECYATVKSQGDRLQLN